jgi:hypothetical protein
MRARGSVRIELSRLYAQKYERVKQSEDARALQLRVTVERTAGRPFQRARAP